VSRDEALARLHVRRADGTVVSGARAFAEIWSCLPRWRLLARALEAVPGAMALAEAAYRVVARHRVRVVATLCARGRCGA
jgi:predicted DCC family thiol-disulfide oxidoreductase YuxK